MAGDIQEEVEQFRNERKEGDLLDQRIKHLSDKLWEALEPIDRYGMDMARLERGFEAAKRRFFSRREGNEIEEAIFEVLRREASSISVPLEYDGGDRAKQEALMELAVEDIRDGLARDRVKRGRFIPRCRTATNVREIEGP